jgi:hypothetical protein
MYYYELQAPGHVNGLVDVNRNLVNEYRYTPFGTPANGFPVEGTQNPLQYMARELDATTGEVRGPDRAGGGKCNVTLRCLRKV